MDKLKTRVLLISLIILALVSISAVAAADSVNDDIISANQEDFDLSEETNDVEQLGANAIDDTDSKGPLTAGESGTFSQLQELINGTPDGETLELDMNYTITSDEKPIIVNKTITIDGKGHTLDANNLNAIMSCLKPVILKNIIFTNAYCTGDYDWEFGYNIYYYGALNFNSDDLYDITCAGSIVDNCTFLNNRAYEGAAIYILSDDITITSSRFKDNEAYAPGPRMGLGGAILWNGDNGILKNSNFTGSISEESGGAIYWAGQDGLIDGCNFTDNKAGSNGGAIDFLEGDNKKITNTYFYKNTADYSGGAISSVIENISIDNCIFEENDASSNGGAFYLISDGPVNITNTKFYNNTVYGENGEEGGAIYVDTAHLLIDHVDFINNTAPTGGAFSIDFSHSEGENINITVSNSNFIENKALDPYLSIGGAINTESPDLTIDTCQFDKNTAIHYGGAICSISVESKINVTNSNFNENKAQYGGAISCAGANSIIDHSTFENNIATSFGGAVYTTYGNNIVVNDSEFNENTAQYGGAMFVNGPNNIVKNSKFNDNNATARAGAIYVAGANALIDNDEFKRNTATAGGAIYTQGNNLFVNKGTFEENNATDAGAIYASAGQGNTNNLNINDTKFINNNATRYGGALVMNIGGTTDINNSNFNMNKAFSGSAIYHNIGSLVVSNTDLLENLANSTSLTLEVADIKNHFDVFFKTDFQGYDNLLNGIYTANNDVTLTNVDYHGFEEEMNTGDSEVAPVASADESEDGALVYKDAREAGINITVCVFDENDNFLFNLTDMTDIYGNNSVSRLALPAGKYKAYAVHEEDAYYTYIKSETILFEIEEVKAYVSVDRVVNYTGAVVTVIANVTDADGHPIDGGTATYIIHYDNKLSSGLLMAAQEGHTADVIDGKAVFEGIILGAPGVYPSSIEYSGNGYYTSATNKSEVEVLPLNTTTESDDVSGSSGDKVDIVAEIVDQNGNPVQNGTAVLKLNGKEYKAEVKDGKATFKGVELPSESTEATIDYLGNDYYNPSKTTIQITINEEPEPEPEPQPEPVTPVAEKTVPAIPVAGNPIALVVLALLTLVSTVSFGRKK